MLINTFLTVGTNDITEEKFVPVSNKDNVYDLKPLGGIWLTEYYPQYNNYNEWVDFMLRNPYVLFYKFNDAFKLPCSMVALNENSNIFMLDSEEKYQYLCDKYPLGNGKFDYIQMSNDYDGIYVSLSGLASNDKKDVIYRKFANFGINSIVLFNMNCIDYYVPGFVNIEPFDYEYFQYEPIEYTIDLEDKKKAIRK